MKQGNKSRKEVADAIGVSYYTFTSWVTGKKYPRMDKVEMLAEYFGILKSDLIENKANEDMQEKKRYRCRYRYETRFRSGILRLCKTALQIRFKAIIKCKKYVMQFYLIVCR